MTGDKDWTIRPYRVGDEQGILECLVAAYGRWPGVDIAVPPIEHLRWKLSGAPGDLQSVVDDGTTIVGGRLVLALPFQMQERVLMSCTFVDLMVHPGYQARGAMKAMWEESLALGERMFNITVAFAGHSAVQRYMAASNMRAPANRIYLFERELPSPPSARNGWPVREASHFEEHWASSLAEASRPFVFLLHRTPKHLNWRYADPRAGRFRIFVVEDGGRLLGYAVFTTSRGRAVLADLLVLPGRDDVIRCLLNSAEERTTALGLSSLRCWSALHHPYREVMLQAGFAQKRPVKGLVARTYGDTELGALFDDEHLPVHVSMGDTDAV